MQQENKAVNLFVGCVPAQLSLSHLKQSFCRFVAVVGITRLKQAKSRQTKNSGSCIVTVRTAADAETLLNKSPFTVCGRTLNLERFQTGKQKEWLVAERNGRRFFLKGVPHTTTLERVGEEFSEKYGAVENVHFITPKNRSYLCSETGLTESLTSGKQVGASNKKKQFTNIVSIQFVSIEHSSSFSSRATVTIDNQIVTVEQYNYFSGRVSRPATVVKNFSKVPIQKLIIRSLGVGQKGSDPLCRNGSLQPQGEKKMSTSSELAYSLKPTRKAYHLSQERFDWQTKKPNLELVTNLRFNLSSSHHHGDSEPSLRCTEEGKGVF